MTGLLMGILIASSGVVQVQRNNAWVPVKPGETLNAGERMRTLSGSSASLQLAQGQVVALNQGTEVQLRDNNGTPVVQLNAGDIQVSSATDIQVAAKDTTLQSVERPLQMQVGLHADQVDVMVSSGAVKNGSVTMRGMAEDSSVRTYTADASSLRPDSPPAYSSFYLCPYFSYGNPGNGAAAPPPPAQTRPSR